MHGTYNSTKCIENNILHSQLSNKRNKYYYFLILYAQCTHHDHFSKSRLCILFTIYYTYTALK